MRGLPLILFLSMLAAFLGPALAVIAQRPPRQPVRFDFDARRAVAPTNQQQETLNLKEEVQYTPAELKKNAILKKLGLPPDPPKAAARRPMSGMDGAGAVEEVLNPPMFYDMGRETYASKGYIGIHKDSVTGPRLGFLDCHRLVLDKADATEYAFIQAGPVMEVRVVGTQYRLAVTSGPLGVDLGTYSKNFHLPRHTLFSSIPGAGPNHDKMQSYLFETSVFTHTPDGNEIEVQWVNRNGQYTTTEIGLMDGRIYFTADIRTFRTFTNRKVDQVAFKWYPVN